MRVIVCGDRHWSKPDIIRDALKTLPRDTTIIHGNAPGADRQAGIVAKELGMKVEEFPANWTEFGRAAGPIRNKQMLDSGVDLVLAFHLNLQESKGTANMIKQAQKRNVPVKINLKIE